MKDLELGIDFKLNSNEASAEAARIRESVRGVGDSAEKASAQLAQTVNRVRGNFNGLQNSINQISRELPAFTYSAQTGFMAISNNLPILIDEIGRLKTANAELTASGGKATPVWKQLIGGLFSWGTALSVGVTLLTVYGKEIGNFIGELFKGKEAIDKAKERLNLLNKTLDGADWKKAITSTKELTDYVGLAKKGFIDKKAVVDKYNETLGKTTGYVGSLKEVEKALADNANAYVKMTLYKAAANLAAEEAAKKLMEAEKIRLKDISEFTKTIDMQINPGFSSGGSLYVDEVAAKDAAYNAKKRAEERKNAKIKEAEDAQKTEEDIAKRFREKAASISKQHKFNFFGNNEDPSKGAKKAENEYKTIIDGYENMREKLAELDRQYNGIPYDDNQAELYALKQKFADFRQPIEKENEKIAEYNKTHKKKIGLIDVSEVAPIEATATANLKFNQETEAIKANLDRQKKLYEDFENYKSTFGEAKAKERFANEIDINSTYLAQTAKQFAEATAIDKARPGGATAERVKVTEKTYNDAVDDQQKQYADAFQLAMSHEQELQAIREKYATIANALGKNITESQKEELKRRMDDEITSANQTAFQKTDIYKNMARNVAEFTREQLASEIKKAEGLLSSATLPEDIKARVEKNLNDLKGRLSAGADDSNLTALNQRKAGLTDLLKLAKTEDDLIFVNAQLSEVQQRIDAIDRNGDGVANWADGVSENFAYLKGDAADFANGLSGDLGQLSGAFGELANAVGESDAGLADTLGTIGELAGVAGNAAGAVASFAGGDIVGGITKAVGAVAGLLSIGAKARESERKAMEDIKKYHDEVFESQLAYNAELRKRIADETKLNDLYESRLENIREEQQANKQQREQAVVDMQDITNRLLKAQTTVGMRSEKYGGFLGISRKTRAVEETSSVAQALGIGRFVEKDLIPGLNFKYKVWEPGQVEITDALFERLEKLNSQKPLTGEAKTAYDQLKKIKDKFGSLEEASRQLEIERKNVLTGTTAQSLGDSIRDGIAQGKKAFADFAEDIEGFLRNGILAGMSTKIIEPQIQLLQDDLAKYLEDGALSKQEKEAFQSGYMRIVDGARDYVKMLDEVGVGLDAKSKDSPNTIRGNLSQASAQQVDALTGSFYGMRTELTATNNLLRANSADQLAAIKQQTLYQLEIAQNTLRTADNTDRLKNIENALNSIDRKTTNVNNNIRANGG